MKSKDKVYDFIVEYMENHLYAPSIRDICEGTGLKSTSTVYQHLINLDIEEKIKCEGVRRITPMGYRLCKDDIEKSKS